MLQRSWTVACCGSSTAIGQEFTEGQAPTKDGSDFPHFEIEIQVSIAAQHSLPEFKPSGFMTAWTRHRSSCDANGLPCVNAHDGDSPRMNIKTFRFCNSQNRFSFTQTNQQMVSSVHGFSMVCLGSKSLPVLSCTPIMSSVPVPAFFPGPALEVASQRRRSP